jgi:hypothetical protein
MPPTASLCPLPYVFSSKSDLRLAHRQTVLRLEISQLETLRIDVGTFVADDSLVVDSLPAERFYELPAAIVTFMMRSARRGYCPPIPALRRLGFRTRKEVEAQRLAECWRW